MYFSMNNTCWVVRISLWNPQIETFPTPGLFKIGITKKNADFTGNKVTECADFKGKKGSLLYRQFQAYFVFAVVRLTSMVFICWQFAHSLSLYLPWFMSKSMHRVVLAMPKSRNTPFQDKQLIEFTLKVTQHDAKTGKVCTVRCQFCSFFGRAELLGQKRQWEQTKNDKIWESFRKEYYRKHHFDQHSIPWREYKWLSNVGKAYFANKM